MAEGIRPREHVLAAMAVPLWRKLTTDPPPEVLRLPPKPPRPARPERARPPGSPATAPPRRRPASAAEPPPCLPAWPPPLWGA
jgi:hypothetical protein